MLIKVDDFTAAESVKVFSGHEPFKNRPEIRYLRTAITIQTASMKELRAD
jgi:hypothetical protein